MKLWIDWLYSKAQKVVETTVRFSNLENDWNYGQIGSIPSQKSCLNNGSIFKFRKWLTMDRFAIIQVKKIVETTFFIFQFRKWLKLWIDWLYSKAQKFLKQRFRFPIYKVIETMDRLGLIQARENVQATVRFSNLESDLNYG